LHNPSAMNVARLFLDSQNQQPTDEWNDWYIKN
jgi:hypothetical protein